MDLWSFVPPAWQVDLAPVREVIVEISVKISATELQNVLPAPENIFRALNVAPDKVNVVIVGQDPYPNRAHACGLSFSVPAGTTPLPGSLRNILAEVKSDIGQSIVTDGNLQPWVDQGVMLLNQTLTVQEGESLSHATFGWDAVTAQILQVVAQKSPHAIAVLWGKHAQKLEKMFVSENVITGVHPSPLSAHRGFLGSRPFSQVNALRQQRHLAPIQW